MPGSAAAAAGSGRSVIHAPPSGPRGAAEVSARRVAGEAEPPGGRGLPRVAATPGAPASILCEGMPCSLSRARGGGGGSGAAPSHVPTWSPGVLGIAGPARRGGGARAPSWPRSTSLSSPSLPGTRVLYGVLAPLEFGSLPFWSRDLIRPSRRELGEACATGGGKMERVRGGLWLWITFYYDCCAWERMTKFMDPFWEFTRVSCPK